MKNKQPTVPTISKLNLLRQICNLIPEFLVSKLARQTGVDKKARSFTPWSHLVALLFAQLTHSIGLNDVCDALGLHSGPLSSIRGAKPPSRNNLSHANKVRPAALAEKLFGAVFEHLGKVSPRFLSGQGGKRFARKFKRTIHLVDSTTIPLIAACMDWAKHRRRKAAAKCHLRLDLQSFLPRFAIVDTARDNDNKRARELCAGIKAGEIVIFDKAYVDFAHLADLSKREVFWVTRAKENLSFKVRRRYQKGPVGQIVRDDLIGLQTPASRQDYPELLRRIVALVEVDGREVEMVFLSNNLQWSAQSILELYRCRWQIEVFFKQVKQTLQLADFLGTSANAVRWQVWTALLVYLLLRYLAFLSNWSHSFTRLFTVIRACLWKKWELLFLLRKYGTASGHFRYLAHPEQAYLPGLMGQPA
jgi:IS4 transposase